VKPDFIELTFCLFAGSEAARLVRVSEIQMMQQLEGGISFLWLRGDPERHIIKENAADVVEAIARHATVLGEVRR